MRSYPLAAQYLLLVSVLGATASGIGLAVHYRAERAARQELAQQQHLNMLLRERRDAFAERERALREAVVDARCTDFDAKYVASTLAESFENDDFDIVRAQREGESLEETCRRVFRP